MASTYTVNAAGTSKPCDVPIDRVVALARSQRAEYTTLIDANSAPDLAAGEISTVAQQAVRDLFRAWGLDRDRVGTAGWNPLGDFIPAGSRVVIKPNWVRHWNQSGKGLDCLLTHTSVIEAVLEYVALTCPSRIIIGDAPLQSCDFQKLRAACQLDSLVSRFQERGLAVELRDFRRTVLHGNTLEADRSEQVSGMQNYVVFDLRRESLLEPITETGNFRVTVYNPDFLGRTHGPGRHQYLIARECIDADVVINLPKLKCHKKAGITGSLKNLVGINGNKEYLPHHRKGSSAGGGDCYREKSWLKGRAEDLLDAANRRSPGKLQRLFARTAELTGRVAEMSGADGNVDGSWCGNDTIWRTCLDLQRILRYGRSDGSMADRPQRTIISITDAIVAGEGDGPLAPTPIPAGFLTGALNPAAAEWVHARLMGFDPQKIALVREAFRGFSYRLADFDPGRIQVWFEDRMCLASELHAWDNRSFRPPNGWRGHCELGVPE
jgi:uncharacterized protein (DUF362 family)